MRNSYLRRFKLICRPLLPESCWTFVRFWLYRLYKRDRLSINGLDEKLEKYISYNEGYYVELGANDGFSQSNTFFLEKKKRWKGVLVEPCFNLYLDACFYRGKNNKLFCNACVPFEFDGEFVSIEWGNFRSRSVSLDSDIIDIDHFDAQRKDSVSANTSNVVFGAQARTLNSILDIACAPLVIDFLSLDVEGAELSVLRGIDFSRYRFKFILVECRNLKRLEFFLRDKGYLLVDKMSDHDYLFKLPDSLLTTV